MEQISGKNAIIGDSNYGEFKKIRQSESSVFRIMKKSNDVLLSGGTVPWMGIKEATSLAKKTGFTGIEVLPVRKVVREVNNEPRDDFREKTGRIEQLRSVKSLHHSWRLDEQRIPKLNLETILFGIARPLFFPKIDKSERVLSFLSRTLNIPVVIHDFSPNWTRDDKGKEFDGGLLMEIPGNNAPAPAVIQKWMKNNNHNFVVDTRDDQSLEWAKKYGFSCWEELWIWIGLRKIKNVQLTLIGWRGIYRILSHKPTLAEEQFIWLNSHVWKGSVTVEANPIMLFLLNKGRLKGALKKVSRFVRTTLVNGKKWSH